jgi:signal peptidase I
MMRRAGAWVVVALLVGFTVVLVGWRLHGGRWVRVETPSMGTTAPVGSLLWVEPVDFATLRKGDLITFTPPDRGATTYTHLVRAVNDDGTVSTQGRITAPDPWRIDRAHVVGKVVLVWPGVGWLVLAAPILVIGGLLVALTASRLRDADLRLPVAVVGGSVVLVVALVVHRPLTRAEQMSFVPVGNGARATYVSTGLLPVRVRAAGGAQVVLHDGEVGAVTTTGETGVPVADGTRHRYAVRVDPALPLSWWFVLVGACFLPALVRAVRRRPTSV